MKIFPDHETLAAYVKENDVITWHGDYGFGKLTFIETADLHIVFSSRKEYEQWNSEGQPTDIQLSLF